jgi:hypothetical protein
MLLSLLHQRNEYHKEARKDDAAARTDALSPKSPCLSREPPMLSPPPIWCARPQKVLTNNMRLFGNDGADVLQLSLNRKAAAQISELLPKIRQPRR